MKIIKKLLKLKKIALYLLLPYFYNVLKIYGELSHNPKSDFMLLWWLGIIIWITVKIIKFLKPILKQISKQITKNKKNGIQTITRKKKHA
jgi:hypothetical protein